MEEVQRALARRYSSFLIDLERGLKKERNLILLQEEMLWLQKSRIEWLKSGDNNKCFFHTSTVVRRRRNKIYMLMDIEGNWVEGRDELKSTEVEYYANLFKSNKNNPATFIYGLFPIMEAQQQGVWGVEFTMKETKKALN